MGQRRQVSPLFHDRFGKFSVSEGEVILDMLLLRRETARAQAKLLVQRAERRGEGLLLLREAISRMRPQKVKEFFEQDKTG